MMRQWKRIAAAALGLSLATGAHASQSILLNGSKESGPGPASLDPQVAANWAEFGVNVERSLQYNNVPGGGVASLKSFGDADSNSAGATQVIEGVSPGQSVTASVKLFTAGNDKLSGSGQAGIVLQFRGALNNLISSQTVLPLTSASSADTWIPATIGPINAPAGTAKVQVNLRLQWTPGDISGAVWWDDAQVIVAGVQRAVNGDFETAGLAQGRPCPGYAQSAIGIDDWTGFNDQERSTVNAKHGVASSKLGVCEPYSGLYQAMDPASEGDVVRLLAYAWNDSDTPLNGNTRFGIKLEFFANSSVPPPEEHLTFDATSPADTWTTVSYSTTVPAEVTRARVVMLYAGDGSTSNSYVYIDSANAERSSAPGVNQLDNASFEDGAGGANGLDHWTEFFSTGTSEARKDCFTQFEDGICSVLARGTAVAGDYQEIPVTAGETLTISGRFYTPTANKLVGTGKAGVKVEWVFGGIPAAVDIGVPNGSPNTIGAGAATDTWIPLTIDYTMPAGSSAGLRFVELIEAGAGTNGAYFDAAEAVILNRYDGADSDNDDDQDMLDVARFQRAFKGSSVAPTAWPWLVFDTDADNDVDIADANYFLPRITGP